MAKNDDKPIGKPRRLKKGEAGHGTKKFVVYAKNPKGNIVRVTFGDANMEIRRDDSEAKKNFRARHKCSSPGPKYKARYWSCQAGWGDKKVPE